MTYFYIEEEKEEKRIEELIRQDNTYIATAQAWSHCMGYTRQVLPGNALHYHTNSMIRIQCLFILLSTFGSVYMSTLQLRLLINMTL